MSQITDNNKMNEMTPVPNSMILMRHLLEVVN